MSLNDVRHDLVGRRCGAFLLGACISVAAGCLEKATFPPTDGGIDPGVVTACRNEAVGFSPTPLRRLARDEYRNTVRDLFGVAPPELSDLPEDGVTQSFRSTTAQTLTPVLAEQYLDAALAVANRVIAAGRVTCPGGDELGCIAGFLAGSATRVFRRPLDADEIEHYRGVFATARSSGTFDDAARDLVAALLVAPQFLFHLEPRPEGAEEGKPYVVDDYRMAARLSYVFWHTLPDAELFQLAQDGKLHDAAAIAAQGKRLFEDARARPVVRDFLAQWLALEKIPRLQVDTAANPAYTSELLDDLNAESVGFTEAAFMSADSMQALLYSPVRYRNARLASFYGDGLASGHTIGPVTGAIDEKSFGLLSQAGFLAAISRNPDNDIIYRGRYVRERFLCGKLSPPPPSLVSPLPAVTADASNRQRVSEHTGAPVCDGCHSQMNPIGFSMEHFDFLGRWRDEERGLPIDASVEIAGTDVGFVNGARQLSEALANSEAVRSCATRQIFEYATGRPAGPGDACAVSELTSLSTRSMRDLFIAVARNPAFLLRVEPKP